MADGDKIPAATAPVITELVRARLGELPDVFRATRASRKASLRTVTRETGVNPQSLLWLERGRLIPTTEKFLAVVAWLQLPPDWWTRPADECAVRDAYLRGVEAGKRQCAQQHAGQGGEHAGH